MRALFRTTASRSLTWTLPWKKTRRQQKQTIIECLKQATTGELPPNTRSGQSFIHDPRVRRFKKKKKKKARRKAFSHSSFFSLFFN